MTRKLIKELFIIYNSYYRLLGGNIIMGMTLWFIGIDKKGKLHRLPSTLFDGKQIKLKNQEIRVAELIVDLKNRKPQKIIKVYYYKLKLDQNGFMERSYYNKTKKLQLESINFLGEGLTNKQIVSRKQYEVKYTWYPSHKEFKLINQYLNQKGLPLSNLLTY